MRRSRLACLALALSLAAAVPAAAQPPRAQITGARVGFPGGAGKAERCRTGLWAPVYVDVQAGLDRLPSTEYELVVETTDADDMQNVYVERRFRPTLEAKESRMLLTYARPGNAGSDVTVTLRSVPDGRTISKYTPKPPGYGPMDPNLYVYLTLGGPLLGMKRALTPRAQNAGVNVEVNAEDLDPDDNGTRRFAHADTAEQLPTEWFAYQAADTVLLTTGSEQFVADLNKDNDEQAAARLKALAEWVRRGGRLVVSVGHNHQHVGQILAKMELIDLQVKGQAAGLKRLHGVEKWAGTREPFRGRPARNNAGEDPDVEVAGLIPGKGVRVLAAEPARGGTEAPVIVEGPCGLGRVLVIGFDVDQPPFTSWKGQKYFWEAFRRTVEPADVGNANPNPNFQGNWFGQENELGTKLVNHLEAFPDVPVISFGWVALFILVYILIVGPLDYFFLKKVVKRLELTWITFPAVVIVISAAAYFAAYYLKGNDLRINKIDVVDIDLHQPHAYGSTWFTLFSPRIQNYTVGVEPAVPGWAAQAATARNEHAALVGWMGRPENVYGGMGRGGSQGLFRRAYDYAPGASGLLGVPIQVWTTKSFAASWHRPLGENELVEADLKFKAPDPQRPQEVVVVGSITSHLPVELGDVILFYRGNGYHLNKQGDRLAPDQKAAVELKGGAGPGGDVNLQTWFAQDFTRPTPAPSSSSGGRKMGPAGWQQQAQPIGKVMKSVLFFSSNDADLAHQQPVRNSTLRELDQRWRLDRDNKDEVVLFGRASLPGRPAEGDAEEVSQSGLSASRLWLGALPGEGKRGALKGTLSQETYVRVFIPVAPK
jgi:hypothetical protein